MAVALLARRPEPLTELATSLRSSNPGAVLETFPTDTSPEQLRKAFGEIRNHKSFQGLKLDLAVFSIKNSAKKPFMEETVEGFMETLEDCKFVTCVTSMVGVMYESLTKKCSTDVGGAVVFSQEALKLMFEHHGEKTLAEGGEKKGTLIFTGTLVSPLPDDDDHLERITK